MEGTKADAGALRAEWVQRAKDHPNDPLFLLLAGQVQENQNSPEAERLLEAARAQAPAFPAPASELAWFYAFGKWANPAKMKENTDAYFALCPAKLPPAWNESFLLRKDPAPVPETILALRHRLEGEKDPKQLENYAVLWGRECQVSKPGDLDAVRRRVAADLQRLEAMHPHGDAEWQDFLIAGYRQSGASLAILTSREDRLVAEYPHALQAERIVRGRWYTAHPAPADPADAAAWARYNSTLEQAARDWMVQYSDDTMLQRSDLFTIVRDDDAVSEADGLAALNLYLQAKADYKGFGMMNYDDADPPDFLLRHGWEPDRALALLKATRTIQGSGHAPLEFSDNTPDEDVQRYTYHSRRDDQRIVGLFLWAAKQAGKPQEALAVRAAVEDPAPDDKRLLSAYWENRGRYEELQNHPLAALTYFHKALDTRTENPKPDHGSVHDELTAEARALWTAGGGTEATWTLRKAPSSGTVQEAAAQSDWQTPDKPLPAFELSDFAGKTWRSKDLQGKTVILSTWATWCGPCREELPRVQKLYEKLQNRADVQILTLNLDSNPGVVTPFLKEKGYTFPVLAASSLSETIDFIPQVWIVDAKGNWRWRLSGYDQQTDEAFQTDLLGHVKMANDGQ